MSSASSQWWHLPAVESWALKLSKEPKSRSMAAASSPVGRPAVTSRQREALGSALGTVPSSGQARAPDTQPGQGGHGVGLDAMESAVQQQRLLALISSNNLYPWSNSSESTYGHPGRQAGDQHAPPPEGERDSQKKVWFQICAALLNSGVGLPPFQLFEMTCKRTKKSGIQALIHCCECLAVGGANAQAGRIAAPCTPHPGTGSPARCP